MSEVNTLSTIEVIPTGKVLGAEIRGIDFARPTALPYSTRDR
jgi:hypothetical protein